MQWDGIPVAGDDPLLLEAAVGWLLVETVQRIQVGDHVIFVGEVRSLEHGPGQGALVYLDRRYVDAVTVPSSSISTACSSTPSRSGTACARSSRTSAAAAGTRARSGT